MGVLENQRYEIFAQNVSRGKTLTEAYVIAGYKENDGNSSTLAAMPHVANRIKELKGITAARAQVTAERVLAELARIGFADITSAVQVVGGKVQLVDTAELGPDVTAAIAEVRETRDGVAVKFHDKRAALENLGKHLGLFKENIDLNVNVSLADLVNGSYQLERGELVASSPNENTRIIRAEPAGALIEHDRTETADSAADRSAAPAGTPETAAPGPGQRASPEVIRERVREITQPPAADGEELGDDNDGTGGA
jgi:phage terminase small subunit